MHFDLRRFMASCTETNILHINELVSKMLRKTDWTAIEWLTIIGVLPSDARRTGTRESYETPPVSVNKGLVPEQEPTFKTGPPNTRDAACSPVVGRCCLLAEGTPIHALESTVDIFTDASTVGWGGHAKAQKLQAHGP